MPLSLWLALNSNVCCCLRRRVFQEWHLLELTADFFPPFLSLNIVSCASLSLFPPSPPPPSQRFTHRSLNFKMMQPAPLLISHSPPEWFSSISCAAHEERGHMEIKGTQSGSLIFPQLHWLIYITKICHWRSLHISGPNQTRLRDWRRGSQQGARRLCDWSVNFFCTTAPCVVWPTLIYALFSIAGYSSNMPSWLDFQALRFHPKGSIKFPPRLPPLHRCLWVPDGRLAANVWLFIPPVFTASRRLVRIVTEVNMQVAVFCLTFLVSLRGELPSPQLAVAVMKGKQMQNESGLQALFRSVCPGWMFEEKCAAPNKERGRTAEQAEGDVM